MTNKYWAVSLSSLAIAVSTVPASAQSSTGATPLRTPFKYQVPLTVSPQAKDALEQYYTAVAHYGTNRPVQPKSLQDWDQRNAQIAAAIGPYVKANVDATGVRVHEQSLGGVPVLRITSPNYKPSPQVLIYIHGGGYVYFSARTTLVNPALMAVESGLEVISIDYTLAPRGNWKSMTDQVISVYQAVLADHKATQIGLFGDSAGGGMAAGVVLKLRDQNIPLPGALYLISPWSDITDNGDTYTSLAAADPVLDAMSLKWGADAYASPQDQKNPYVSPVYGDYSKPFPPTLIQGGTREIFLSNFVRQYQAIRNGNHEAILDLYEGMPHVFQATAPTVPETQIAIRRAAKFFHSNLEN